MKLINKAEKEMNIENFSVTEPADSSLIPLEKILCKMLPR